MKNTVAHRGLPEPDNRYPQNNGCMYPMIIAFLILSLTVASCKRCYQCTDTTRTVDRAGNELPVQKDQYQNCDENKNGRVRTSTDSRGYVTQIKTECY